MDFWSDFTHFTKKQGESGKFRVHVLIILWACRVNDMANKYTCIQKYMLKQAFIKQIKIFQNIIYIFLQIEYQPNIHQGWWNDMRSEQGLNFPMATEAIACPFLSLAMMPLDQCQPSVYSLPLVGLGAFCYFAQWPECPQFSKFKIQGLGVRIAIFTEIRQLLEELITLLSIFGPQKFFNLTARLQKVFQYQLECNKRSRGLVCSEACPKLSLLL